MAGGIVAWTKSKYGLKTKWEPLIQKNTSLLGRMGGKTQM